MKRKSRIFTIFTAMLCLVFAQMLSAEPAVKPHNRVVIVIDRSGSFKEKLNVAKEAAWKYIRALSNTSQSDEVYIVGVDQQPAQIAYIRGVHSRREAEEEYTAAFAQPSNALGTDWVSGLKLAATNFLVPPVAAANHLLVFGDLNVDNMKDPVSHQVLRIFHKLDNFDWKQFQGVTSWFLFADDNVRQGLLQNPTFGSINPTIWSVETKARLRTDMAPPKHIKVTQNDREGAPPDLSAYLPYVAAVTIFFLAIFLMPAKNKPIRQKKEVRNGR